MSVSVALAASEADRALGRAIRHAVFVVEQAVPPDVEVDGLDDTCQHYLARVGAEAAATARARSTPRGWKIERVAVLAAQRRRSVGAALLRRMLADAPEGLTVYVHAQESALGFWQHLGFSAEGERFFEGGIGHRLMAWTERETQPAVTRAAP
jgi:predicted GNAT family N-acyltransferase